MTGTGWVGTIVQIIPEICFPNAPYGIFAGASQRGRSAEIRKALRVIGADGHPSLTRSNQVARVGRWHIKSWTNPQAPGTLSYFRHALRVLLHTTEQFGHLGTSQNHSLLANRDDRFFDRNRPSPSCRLAERMLRWNEGGWKRFRPSTRGLETFRSEEH